MLHGNTVILAKQKFQATATGEKNEGLFSSPASITVLFTKKKQTPHRKHLKTRQKSPISYLSMFQKFFILYYAFLFHAQPTERTHFVASTAARAEQDSGGQDAASPQFTAQRCLCTGGKRRTLRCNVHVCMKKLQKNLWYFGCKVQLGTLETGCCRKQ